MEKDGEDKEMLEDIGINVGRSIAIFIMFFSGAGNDSGEHSKNDENPRGWQKICDSGHEAGFFEQQDDHEEHDDDKCQEREH